MGSIVQPLNQNQIDEAKQQAQAIADAAQKTIGQNQFVFFAAFDGTNNNLAGSLSGDPQPTNVAQLFKQVSRLQNYPASKMPNISANNHNLHALFTVACEF